jgi:hypothetical protein
MSNADSMQSLETIYNILKVYSKIKYLILECSFFRINELGGFFYIWILAKTNVFDFVFIFR